VGGKPACSPSMWRQTVALTWELSRVAAAQIDSMNFI